MQKIGIGENLIWIKKTAIIASGFRRFTCADANLDRGRQIRLNPDLVHITYIMIVSRKLWTLILPSLAELGIMSQCHLTIN
uniref:Uncharacterized protein n=1 Tax=Romanomermis culicivorax TaxID=13658 RepID=A0A915LBI4_ROMCU